MEEACEECTQNCNLMHKQDKDPSAAVTTFFKVMFGENYSKVMIIPPRFGQNIRKKVIRKKDVQLEDSSGEKWNVKFTKVNGELSFGEGWNRFAEDHKLRQGDFLVFHYIMESHFVVLMYGPSGCPELRQFGLCRPHNEPPKICLNEPEPEPEPEPESESEPEPAPESEPESESESASECSVFGVNEPPKTQVSVGTSQQKDATNVNTERAPSVSDKETSQRFDSEPLVGNTDSDNVVFETSSVKQSCLVDTDIRNGNGIKEDEGQRNSLDDDLTVAVFNMDVVEVPPVSNKETSQSQKSEPLVNNLIFEIPTLKESGGNENENEVDVGDVSIPVVNVDEFDGGWKNDVVAVGGGGDETLFTTSEKVVVLDTTSEESREKPTKKPVEKPIDPPSKNTIKRLSNTNVATPQVKKPKMEHMDIETGTSAQKLHTSILPSKRTGCFSTLSAKVAVLDTTSEESREKPTKKPVGKPIEKTIDPPCNNTIKRLSSTNVAKVATSQVKKPKIEYTDIETGNSAPKLHNRRLPSKQTGSFSISDCKKAVDLQPVKHELADLQPVKEEPADYVEEPQSIGTKTCFPTKFSAVMSSYEYLELPKEMEYKSPLVILLKNGVDYWPVLYINKFETQALTQNWGLFAKARGFKPGDKCEFKLESGAKDRKTCSVFTVDITRK